MERLGADRAGLVDEHDVRVVAIRARIAAVLGSPMPTNTVPVVQLPRGGDGHHLVGGRVGLAVSGGSLRRTFSSIHAGNRSRSLLIASHSV